MKKEKHIQKESSSKNLYKPKTENQAKYVEYLNDRNSNIIISSGPAGTGKTMFACLTAVDMLKKKEINKIVVTRPIVTVEEDIGFLPGNLVKKMDPWTKPLFDIFAEVYSNTEINSMIQNNVIEIVPLLFMRGRTFKNSFIIADEMQNSTPNQMLMLMTRIGVGSKLVITGDLEQTDKLEDNGLKDLIQKHQKYMEYDVGRKEINNTIKLIMMNTIDVQRSIVVEKVLLMYKFDSVKEKKKVLLEENKLSYTTNTTLDFLAINKNVSSSITGNCVELKNATTIKKTNSSLSYFVRNHTQDLDAALIPKNHVSRFFDTF